MSKRNWQDSNDADNMNGLSGGDANGSGATNNGLQNHHPSAGSPDGGDHLKKAKLDDAAMFQENGSAITSINGIHSNGGGMRDRHYSQSGGTGNGGGGGSSHHHHNNTGPSRVVHIRGIANDLHESEILCLAQPFGRASNVLLLKGKNQAFLEMAEESAAIQMVNFYNSGHPCLVKGKHCWVQFSSHKELRTDTLNSNNSVKAQSVLRSSLPVLMAQQCMGMGLIPDGSVLQSHVPYGSGGGNNAGGGPNTILRVVVENALYPVSLDVLHGIFSRFGKVLKIIIFTKNHLFQALIQYPDRGSASSAKQNLDGQNIYTGCCTLRIDYSRMEQLRVTFNNDKSRDYTNLSLPSGDGPALMHTDMLRHLQASMMPGLPGQQGLMHGFGNGNGNVMNDLLQSGPPFNSAMLQGAFGGRQGFLGTPGSSNSVLLVSKFDEELVTPDVLFILFGVYGDVMRVKILFNKKDTALVQMSEPRGAQLALLHLDRAKLFGKQIRVTASRHTDVQMPKEGQPDSGLTRDFSNSPLHRFKKPGSKNFQNIFPPADTLHLSNIPPDVSEEDITRYFTEAGFHVRQCKFFPKDRKMALVQVASPEEGIEALIKMHNFQLNKNTHLRVSFSKTNIRDQQH